MKMLDLDKLQSGDKEEKMIIADYKEGAPMTRLSARYHRSGETIRKILTSHDIEIRDRGAYTKSGELRNDRPKMNEEFIEKKTRLSALESRVDNLQGMVESICSELGIKEMEPVE